MLEMQIKVNMEITRKTVVANLRYYPSTCMENRGFGRVYDGLDM
jgi:hypothetical protein